jgi:flagellar protein FliS
MQLSAREDYLTTEVMTATPQKLQLMLIQGALRMAEQARQCWQQDDEAGAFEALQKCQQVIIEMLSGLKIEVEPDLVKKVAAVYLFIFRSVVSAQLDHDEKQLSEAVSVLEVERETWQQLCEKLGTQRESSEMPLGETLGATLEG